MTRSPSPHEVDGSSEMRVQCTWFASMRRGESTSEWFSIILLKNGIPSFFASSSIDCASSSGMKSEPSLRAMDNRQTREDPWAEECPSRLIRKSTLILPVGGNSFVEGWSGSQKGYSLLDCCRGYLHERKRWRAKGESEVCCSPLAFHFCFVVRVVVYPSFFIIHCHLARIDLEMKS